MLDVKKSEKANGKRTPLEKVIPMNEAQQKFMEQKKRFDELGLLTRKRETLEAHLLRIDEVSNSDDFNLDLANKGEDEEKAISKVILQFGNDRYSAYEVKNPILLDEVRAFLVQRLKERLQQTESQMFELMKSA